MSENIKSAPTPEQRKEAERVYSLEAFDFAANPIGSRDWALFWHGYQAALEAATVCDHVWQAKASNGAHGVSDAECAKCFYVPNRSLPWSVQPDPIQLMRYVPNLAPPVHVTPDPEAKGDIAAWLRRRAHGDLVMIPGRLAGEIADHIDALAVKSAAAQPNMYRMLSRRIGNEKWEHEGRMWVDGVPEQFILDYCKEPNAIREYKIQYAFAASPYLSDAPRSAVEGVAVDVVQEFLNANSDLQAANERGTWTSNYKHPLPFRLDAERRYRAAREALLQAITDAGSKA